MKVTRRQFVKGGVAAFTVTFAAPELLSDLARAQGRAFRNLVVLYLERRQRCAEHARPVQRSVLCQPPPNLAVPAGQRAADRRRFVAAWPSGSIRG